MNSPTPLRAFLQRFVLALVLSFGLTASGIGYAYWFVNDAVDSAERVDGLELDAQEEGEPANFLIIGSDTREFVENAEDAAHFGETGDTGGQRSDTIMIAHVDPDEKSGFLVSFPRDLWVDIPGLGTAKINAAFNEGPQRVVDTIQQNFGIEIHHYLEVNFDGFRNLVDAIGNVPIFFPTAARDVQTGLDIPSAGCVELDGNQALQYVRSREYQSLVNDDWETDGTADIGRIRRQQYFIRSLADEAVRSGFRNPLKITDILNEAVGNLRLDPSLSTNDLRALINAFRDVDPAALDMVTLPTTPERIDGQAALVLIESEAQPIFDRLSAFAGAAAVAVPTDVEPEDVSVKVENGSGVGGQARVVLDGLVEVGFEGVEPPDNADRQDYEVTQVRHGPGDESKAQLVLASLGGAGELVPLDETPAAADVVVVVGRDFDSVGAPSPSAAPAAPAEADAPTTPVPETTTTSGPPPNPGGEGAFPVSGC